MSAITHLPAPASGSSLAQVNGAPRSVCRAPMLFAPRDDAAMLHLAPSPLHTPTPEPVVPEEIETMARKVARGALEVLGGTRPLQQMARLLDARSYERLQLRSNLVRSIEQANGASAPRSASGPSDRLHRNVLIRTVRVCAITPGIFEASVVAAEQKRARAIALRIERWRGQWRVTELQIG